MTDWIALVNYAAAVGGLVVTLLGFLLNLSVPFIDRWTRRFFNVLFALLAAYVVSDLVSQISLEMLGPGFTLLSQAAVFCESLFSSLLMPLITVYLLRCAGEAQGKKTVVYVVSVLWLAYFTMLIVTQFTEGIYYFTPDNVYHRGPWYPVLLLPPVLTMVLNLIAFYRRLGVLTRWQRQAFACYLFIPLACMLIQMAAYSLLMIMIGTCAAALSMFIFILREQMERFIRQQEEIARQRANVLVLQMRPHFIYNTMSSIYYLCRQDADKAQQVIREFLDYLRQNFTAVAKEGTIPFKEEMEHTRAYLAVEQVRYEGSLFVEFDTPHTAFRVPPLTLQPIVENAVKHGVDPELEPLYISIRTRATETGAEITVEDTGPGFAPTDDDEPHIALANIRERLELMCGGTLTIEPRGEGGTVVTIRV